MDYSEAKEVLERCRCSMLLNLGHDGKEPSYGNLSNESRELYCACTVAISALMREGAEQMETVVVVKHFGDNGHYLFSVPEGKKLKEGDTVMVRNKRGEATAKCVCDSFAVGESVLKALAVKYGATLPLAPVIGFMKPEWW